ncbi:bifunctional cobalt-precorrin-7 (C(5))-methyltransferase/cobalt-precorrin-6B (C(15))-methyltransferase [Actinoplanes sp. N902-109]|uniref:bifunctional cobalt-precorrin-7 (C(5))-methyltransferase/cobalt-precorrin-6B (C(15))-methyltransferase n=1 Tax=Actinoplanes sp. (strain N902-109) TaxID=649831 RepID=UPI0003294BED|nr:bifunctional cobalt-precorrin-7 (C(5))-methyltransferase/cobalt-precorrin-6B (C(15))-methyltransferase [Actinoplanes sp. N902-109]AGL20050.1 precorrin-6Y C(5,15)-methyltransferase [Actinoplanes sp. N902-109]
MTDNPARLTVVGIGADGWAGLSRTATAALTRADVILGSARQLDLLPVEVPGDRVAWPSPLLPALPGLLETHRGRRVAVLASGDPMFHGIGATLRRFVDDLDVIPHPSSVSLAAARLGWPLSDVDVLSVVNADVAELHPLIHPNRRILVLGRDAGTPGQVAAILQARGYGDSEMTILGQLGSESETSITGRAGEIQLSEVGSLNVIAIRCSRGGVSRPLVPGLPDDAYDSDGQLTKREVRAVTLALLGPQPGELLWDVGAGSGSIAIEWMRTHPACRAIAVESDPVRAARIEGNAQALGVPKLKLVTGRAPGALAGLPTPDVVFIGGGVTREGVLETAWSALPAGGRLVANAVTLESEAMLVSWHAKLGGDLTRLSVHRAAPVGGFTGWRAMMPVTIWAVVKP